MLASERERERKAEKKGAATLTKEIVRAAEKDRLRRSTIAARLNGLKVRLCKRRNGEG